MPLSRTFRGGVHPPEEKLTSGKPIEPMPAPPRVIIPLSMHTGVPARPLVEKGDEVKRGRIIGAPVGAVSAAVHASISGKVTDVREHISPVGKPVLSVFIESDGKDEAIEEWPGTDCQAFTIDEIREKIKDAGIVGLGGAAFPTHVKLNPPHNIKIDTLIINGVECEPYLTSDHRLMVERPRSVLDGARILRRMFDPPRIFIAVETNKPDAMDALTKAAEGDESIVVVPLKVKYPQGAEKQLIKALTGREVPGGGLPMNVGTLVQNVGTTAAIGESVTTGRPLYERIVTVTGPGIMEPKNVLARIGALFSDLIDFCGGFKGKPDKVIMGGPMMGIAQFTTQVPVVKGTSGILVLSQREARRYKERACIRCGRCVEVCPMCLIPGTFGVMVENNIMHSLEANNILDCGECGSCSFVCPAKRRLVHYIRIGKSHVMAERQKEKQRDEQESKKREAEEMEHKAEA